MAPRTIKRSIKRQYDEIEAKIRGAVLKRVDGEHSIHIDKNEFKIGRARYNDEIISDMAISRKQCILKCGDDNKWKLEDLSTSTTLINNIAVLPKVMQDILPGDIIQFGFNVKFKYRFNIVQKNGVRKQIAANKNNESILLRKITILKNKLQKSIIKQQMINKKEQKWQKALDVKKHKIAMFEKSIQALKDKIKLEKVRWIDYKNMKLNNMKMGALKIECGPNSNLEGKIQNVKIIMNEQFTCSICPELFVKATILNCSHLFCHQCIKTWNEIQMNCPICRTPITTTIELPALDNFIKKMIENLEDKKNIEKREEKE